MICVLRGNIIKAVSYVIHFSPLLVAHISCKLFGQLSPAHLLEVGKYYTVQ